MAFVPRLTSSGMQGNKWWYSNKNIFYASGYGLPNCTCYAYGRYAEIRNAWANLPSGDAKLWYNRATNFERGSEPRLGAIICYGTVSPTDSHGGHVAVVEEIKDNGNTIVTSNSYWRGSYFKLETVYRSRNWLPSWVPSSRNYYFQGFIYNDGDVDPSPPTPTPSPDRASIYVIAAIAGCFARESTVNPGIWESLIVPSDSPPWYHVYVVGEGIGGYGLGQWTNWRNPNTGNVSWRCKNLYDWLTANNIPVDSGDGQLTFMIYEGVWTNSSQTRGNYTSLYEFLNTDSTNLNDLVWDFLANWEGVPGNAYDERLRRANQFLQYMQEHSNDNPSDYQWISKNAFLSESEMLNNVMCMFFYFSNGSPSPPYTPTRKGMPFWMMVRYIKF